MGLLKNLSLNALKETFARYRRTIGIARKPDKEEFLRAARITAIGIAVIGAVGFLIFIFYNLIF